MKKILYDGVEWNLKYFISATEKLEDQLGDNPTDAAVERVQKRYQAIEELQSPSTRGKVTPEEKPQQEKPKSRKTSKKTKSEPDGSSDSEG